MFLKQKWKMMKDGKDLDFFVLTASKWLKIKTLGYFHYSIFFKLYSRHCSASSSFYFISVTKHNKRTPQSFNLMPALCEPGKKMCKKDLVPYIIFKIIKRERERFMLDSQETNIKDSKSIYFYTFPQIF